MARYLPVLLLLVACPEKAPVSEMAPLPQRALTPTYVVAQQAVDNALPPDVLAYEGWDVQWRGGQPERIVLERYRRGECFTRTRYAPGARGMIVAEEEEASGAAGGGPVLKDKLLLAEALHLVSGPRSPTRHHERDPARHLTWVYDAAPTSQGPPLERITNFAYAAETCVAPAILDRGRVPPRQRPAGNLEAVALERPPLPPAVPPVAQDRRPVEPGTDGAPSPEGHACQSCEGE